MRGRDDSELRCMHGLFLLPSWLAVSSHLLYYSKLSLFSCIIYSLWETAMSLLEKKEVQPMSNTVGSKHTHEFQSYLSNCFSPHFAIVQEEPFSTTIWPKNIKELVSGWNGKNTLRLKINPWKQNKWADISNNALHRKSQNVKLSKTSETTMFETLALQTMNRSRDSLLCSIF